ALRARAAPPARALRPQRRRPHQQPAPEAGRGRRRDRDRDLARHRLPPEAAGMKPSLFWKIAGAFWLTLGVATLGIVAAFVVLTHPKPGSPGVFDQIRAERLQAARVALHYGGRPALDAVIASWSPEDRRRLELAPGPGGELEPRLPRSSSPN